MVKQISQCLWNSGEGTFMFSYKLSLRPRNIFSYFAVVVPLSGTSCMEPELLSLMTKISSTAVQNFKIKVVWSTMSIRPKGAKNIPVLEVSYGVWTRYPNNPKSETKPLSY